MGSERVGYTTGVYDLFHVGHLNLLTRAREQCDRLIVGVTTDELALSVKGRRPTIPFEERAAIVKALRVVDEVVPQASMQKLDAWEKHRFDVVFVGDDHKGTRKWDEYEKAFADRGVAVVYFPYTLHTSSTLLNQALNRLVQPAASEM